MRVLRHWIGLGLIAVVLLVSCGEKSNDAKIESVNNARPSPPITETPATPTVSASTGITTTFDDMRLPDGVQLDGSLLIQRESVVYHAKLDGTPPQSISQDIAWYDLSIAPDQQNIAYLYETPGVDPGPTPPPDAMVYIPPPTSLALLDLATGESRLVYASDGGLNIIGWSPDGTWLAFREAIYPPYDPALVATSEFGEGFTFYRATPENSLLAVSLQPDTPLARLDGGSNALWLTDNTLLALVETYGENTMTQNISQLLPDANQALPLETDQAWQVVNVFWNIEFRPTAQSILDGFGLTLAPVSEGIGYYNRALSPDGSMYVEITTSSSPVPIGTEVSACSLHNIILRGIERAILPEPIVVLDKGNVVGVSNLTWLPVEDDPEAIDLVYLVLTSPTCDWDNYATTLVHRQPDSTITELVAPTSGIIGDVIVPPHSRVVLWVWQDEETEQSTLNLYEMGSGRNHVLAQSNGALFGAMWWVGK